jgi:hypothetical protein
MRLLGIDNGLGGSLALLDTDTNTVEIKDVQLTPLRELDCPWIFQTISDWGPDRAVIEYCHNNNGLVERGGYYIAVCNLLEVPIEKIAVNKWKKAILGQSTNNKPLSVETCQRLLPQADISRPSPKRRVVKPDHNRAEAALMALYLKRTISP